MPQDTIEEVLKKAGKKEGLDFYGKYLLLKDRLFTTDYSIWAMKFSRGNDHGPQHVSRVLEYLECLLGKNPVERNIISAYEVFLTVMSILYHDIDFLHQLQAHPNFSQDLAEQETSDYIFDPRDKDVIQAALMNHDSHRDVELVFHRFLQEEPIGKYVVRPYLIAALVRFADKLDEDYRRAYPIAEERIQLHDGSQFFWQFCQRITGIQPDQQSHEILISVKFESEDIGRKVSLDGNVRPFIWAFAEKLVQINRERVLLNRLLPKKLQYHSIKVTIRPFDEHRTWDYPRTFILNDQTSPSDFVAAYPELLAEAPLDNLERVLELMKIGQYEYAEYKFQKLEEIGVVFPAFLHLRTLYLLACFKSRRAHELSLRGSKHKQEVDDALKYLRRWLGLGISGGWEQAGQNPQNEIHDMSHDIDLYYMLSRRKSEIQETIPDNLKSALSWKAVSKRARRYRRGGKK